MSSLVMFAMVQCRQELSESLGKSEERMGDFLPEEDSSTALQDLQVIV